MRQRFILGVAGLAAMACILASGTTPPSFPEAQITNGLVQARLYLPDTAQGYYRSTRFDWSGVMPSLTYQGHSYSGQWFDKYDPRINDAIMGPVESFSPLGYEEAAAGGNFTQIGVGVLQKAKDQTYSPFRYYNIMDAGQWTVQTDADAVHFTHTVGGDYAYHYEKDVRLVQGKPVMELIHHLKNTGTRTIETDVYDHNLFMLDGGPTGPGCVIRFPFALRAEEKGRRGFGDIAEIHDSEIRFLRKPGKREQAYAILHGYGSQASDYDIRMENQNSGAGVRITSDQPLSRLVFWACATTFCPEPYIHIKVAPGETFSWTLTYTFYTIQKTD